MALLGPCCSRWDLLCPSGILRLWRRQFTGYLGDCGSRRHTRPTNPLGRLTPKPAKVTQYQKSGVLDRGGGGLYNDRFTVMDFFDLVDWNYGPAGTRWAALFYGLTGAIQP